MRQRTGAGRRGLVLLVLVGACCEAPAASPATATSPNILFIMVDTVRADHVGCYGYAKPTTPAIDRLASGGVRLDQMIASSSWTMPSLMSMFTSLHPSQHGATSYRARLRPGIATLAALLSHAGYQTAGFSSNPTAHSKFGFGRGFDLYDDFTVMLAADLNLFDDFGEQRGYREAASSPVVNRLALDWLRRYWDRSRPFFLFALYFDPHADYTPPPPYDTMFCPGYTGSENGQNMYVRPPASFTPEARERIRALYDGEIRCTDDHIGVLLRESAALGALDNTVTILVSDHGEEFWDHGGILHGQTLYDEVVRVPCIFHWPGHLAAGKVLAEQASHVDILPTLLAAASIAVPPYCAGRDLLPMLRGDVAASVREARMETGLDVRHLIGVRTPQAKLLHDLTADRREWYDLRSDPAEAGDLVSAGRPAPGAEAASLDQFRALVAKAREDHPAPETQPDLPPALLKALQAHGYLHGATSGPRR